MQCSTKLKKANREFLDNMAKERANFLIKEEFSNKERYPISKNLIPSVLKGR